MAFLPLAALQQAAREIAIACTVNSDTWQMMNHWHQTEVTQRMFLLTLLRR